jgi:hypothetical protein
MMVFLLGTEILQFHRNIAMRRFQVILFVCLFGWVPCKAALAQEIASRSAAPNVLVDVSGLLVDAVVQRPIQDTQPVRDVVEGVPVYGTSSTRAQVHARLVPDPHRAVVDVMVRGTTLSRTVAYARIVNVYTTTTIAFEVRKRILIDQGGIRGLPARAYATASTQLLGITNTDGEVDTLSTLLARWKFNQEKEEADLTAANMAKSQLIQRLEREFQPQLARGNQALARGTEKVQEIGLHLEQIQWSTTAQYLRVWAHVATPSRPGPVPPSPELVEPADLSVRIHESVIHEILRAALAGKLGKPGMGSLAITFADKDPVTVAFAEKGFKVTVHGSRYSAEGAAFPGMKITAAYKWEAAPGKIVAIRQGPLQIQPLNSRMEFGKVFPERKHLILEKYLQKVLMERLAVMEIPLPNQITLVPTRVEARNGWLLVTWNRQQKG